MTLSKLAFKNLFRKRMRSIFIALVAALASGLIFFAAVVTKSVERGVDSSIEMLGADILVVPAGYEAQGQKILLAGEPSDFYMDVKNVGVVAAVRGVLKASPQLFMAPAKLQCCGSPDVLLVGYDPDSDFTVAPWVIRPLPRFLKQYADRDPVTIGGNMFGFRHDDVKFYGTKFRIAGVLRTTGLKFFDKSVFMTMDVARKMIEVSKTKALKPLTISPNQISSVLVKVRPGHDTHRVASDIESSVPGVKTIEMKEAVVDIRNEAKAVMGSVASAGFLCWIMTIVLMGIVVSLTVNERTREMAVLRAVGATKVHVFRLVTTEALMLTAIGSVAGVGIAFVVIVNFKKLIIASLSDAPFLWPSPGFIIAAGAGCVLLMLASSVAAVLYPALRTCRREPYEALMAGR